MSKGYTCPECHLKDIQLQTAWQRATTAENALAKVFEDAAEKWQIRNGFDKYGVSAWLRALSQADDRIAEPTWRQLWAGDNLPPKIPKHLARRGMRPDGSFPLADDDEPAAALQSETPSKALSIEDRIYLWSMRPQPGTPDGIAWGQGAKQGWEWAQTEPERDLTRTLAECQRLQGIGANLQDDVERLRTGIQAMHDSTEHQNIRNMCKELLEGKS